MSAGCLYRHPSYTPKATCGKKLYRPGLEMPSCDEGSPYYDLFNFEVPRQFSVTNITQTHRFA